MQSRKSDSIRAAQNNGNSNKPTDENKTQEFELNAASHKKSTDQHRKKSRPQDTPKGYVHSVLMEKNLLQ